MNYSTKTKCKTNKKYCNNKFNVNNNNLKKERLKQNVAVFK